MLAAAGHHGHTSTVEGLVKAGVRVQTPRTFDKMLTVGGASPDAASGETNTNFKRIIGIVSTNLLYIFEIV